MPASTTPSRVRVEGCLKKKGVYPFNKGPTPGPSQEFSHYLPTASSARQREWDRFWSAVGRSPGSAEQELPGCWCQSPGLRALLEEVDNGRQVSTPAPAGELWGGWGFLKPWRVRRRVTEASLGREVPGRHRAGDFGNELSPKAS